VGGSGGSGQCPPMLRHSPRSTPFSQEGFFPSPLRHQGSTPDLNPADDQQEQEQKFLAGGAGAMGGAQGAGGFMAGPVSQRSSPAAHMSPFAAQRSRSQVMLSSLHTPGSSSTFAVGSLAQALQQAAAAAAAAATPAAPAGIPSLANWQVAQVIASSQVHSPSHDSSTTPSFTMPHPPHLLQHQPVTPLMGSTWQATPLMMQRNASSLLLSGLGDGMAVPAGTSPGGGGLVPPSSTSIATVAGTPAGMGGVSTNTFTYTPSSSHMLTSSVIMTLAAAVQGEGGGLMGHRHVPGTTNTSSTTNVSAPGGKHKSRGTGSPQPPASGTLPSGSVGGTASAPRSPINPGHSPKSAALRTKSVVQGTDPGTDPASARDSAGSPPPAPSKGS
jgi:hypothetical protein